MWIDWIYETAHFDACAYFFFIRWVTDYVTFFIFLSRIWKCRLLHILCKLHQPKMDLSRLKRRNGACYKNGIFARHPKCSYQKCISAVNNEMIVNFRPEHGLPNNLRIVERECCCCCVCFFLLFYSFHFRWSRVHIKLFCRLSNVCNFIHRNLSLVLHPMPFKS